MSICIRIEVPYLFELRHLVPRPNFEEGGPLFKKSKDQYIIVTIRVQRGLGL